MKKISIAIPTWERTDLLFKSFEKIYDDDRVDEIVIVDDCSSQKTIDLLIEKLQYLDKVKLYLNLKNSGCYQNKQNAICFCSNEYLILLDSDNIIDTTYIDAIYKEKWLTDTILTPDFAKPHFDFRAFSGLTISKENVSEYIDLPMFETMLNAANYFVNKDNYLKVYDAEVEPMTSDSIFMCYNWLKNGFKIKVVKNMQYFHRVHEGSHYKNNVHKTKPDFHKNIIQKIKELK